MVLLSLFFYRRLFNWLEVPTHREAVTSGCRLHVDLDRGHWLSTFHTILCIIFTIHLFRYIYASRWIAVCVEKSMRSLYLVPCRRGRLDEDTGCLVTARVKQNKVLCLPMDRRRGECQWPNVRYEEFLRLIFFNVSKFQLGKLSQSIAAPKHGRFLD